VRADADATEQTGLENPADGRKKLLDLLMDSFFYLVMFAGAIAGASTGLLGVYIVGMRMPFIGICISHAAMAGTVMAYLLGFNPAFGAVAASVITSMSLAAIRPEKSRLDTNVGLGILFSLMLGSDCCGAVFFSYAGKRWFSSQL